MVEPEVVAVFGWVLSSLLLAVWLRPSLLLGSAMTLSSVMASMSLTACSAMILLCFGSMAPVRIDRWIVCGENEAMFLSLGLWALCQGLGSLLLLLASVCWSRDARRASRAEIVLALGIFAYLTSLRRPVLCEGDASIAKRLLGLAGYSWCAFTFYFCASLEDQQQHHSHEEPDVFLDDDDDHDGDHDDEDPLGDAVSAIWDKAATNAGGVRKGAKAI